MPEPMGFSASAYAHLFDKSSGIFGPNFQELMNNLNSFRTALPISEQERKAMDIATGTTEDFDYTMGNLNTLLGDSMEGAKTGFRQDIAPLIPQAQRQFTDFLGNARSQFADSNILTGSDFARNVGSESARLSENLAARQFDENVRAAQARGDWTALAQNLNVLSKSFPLAYSADLYGMGEKNRKSEEEIRGRPYAMFQSLSGLENQVPYFQQGYNANSSSAANLNALSQALSSINLGGFSSGGGMGGGTYNPTTGGVPSSPGWLG